MNPNIEAPVIYPIDLGKEMVMLKKENKWFNLLDKQTGLVGWSAAENFSSLKPEKPSQQKTTKSFEIFKERVLEMSKSIKEAISIDTFIDVEHLGGRPVVIADDDWFSGRRHANQSFSSIRNVEKSESVTFFFIV